MREAEPSHAKLSFTMVATCPALSLRSFTSVADMAEVDLTPVEEMRIKGTVLRDVKETGPSPSQIVINNGSYMLRSVSQIFLQCCLSNGSIILISFTLALPNPLKEDH